MGGVVKHGDCYVAGIFLEREMKAESAVEFTGGYAFTKASVEFLQVGAGSDLLEEILSDDFLPGEAGERLFASVISKDVAFGVELDNSVRETIQ
jgi:hypothetical protein